VEYMAACQLTAVEGFPGTPAPVLWSTYLGTGQVHHKNIKWATDPDPDMVIFLSTIDKSKEFYTTIVDK